MWSVTLNGVDITSKVANVSVTFAAENVAGECTVEVADRDVLEGIVVPRVPRERLISVDKGDGSAVLEFYLESIDYPPSLTSRTATIWGRTEGARMTTPWAQKVSRQWPTETTVDAIVQGLAAMCGVAIDVANDYPACAYCYAVNDQSPSEILHDLGAKSGDQVPWPQRDGSIVLTPRLYAYGAPDVTLTDQTMTIDGYRRTVPDFGNRVLVSGDGAVAGLSVVVVPMYASNCVRANGADQVRLLAVVLDADGEFVASGTSVAWAAMAGSMAAAVSVTGISEMIGEVQTADDYTHVTLDLPASTVIGVYAFSDVRRRENLYTLRRGSVSGRVITFESSLDFFDQALIVDYEVLGAINTWTAGYTPGDVSVTASVAGAQGMATLHQSNPSACGSSIVLESIPSDVCLGGRATITAKVRMFDGAGSGPITFSLDGCGALSSSRKILGSNAITEKLRTSNWGGVSQVTLSAIPVAGTTPAVYLASEDPMVTDLYASHDGEKINLDTVLTAGTEVVVQYQGGGTAMISWIPSGGATGEILVREQLLSAVDDTDTVVTLSRTPTDVVMITQSSTYMVGPDLTGTVTGAVVTLNTSLTEGTALYCTYWAEQDILPDCTATIKAKVEDGSQDGASAEIKVTARDCREQADDPVDPPEETSEDDPRDWPDLDDDEDEDPPTATGCTASSIVSRTPKITSDNHDAVFGVTKANDCPGMCTCDEICAALRSAGKLAEVGLFYSQCKEMCDDTREKKCTPCTLTGPATLAPGATDIWSDDKGNTGDVSGPLTVVSKSSSGYTLRMPTGGTGPFVIKVCYGGEDGECCEAQVDFPACSVSGPTELDPGEVGEFVPSLGMTNVIVLGSMEVTEKTSTLIKAKLPSGACAGDLTVNYGGRVCGTVHVESSVATAEGTVTGDEVLEAGEEGTYAHNLPGTVTYTGSLELVSAEGSSAVLKMPDDATAGTTYVASWQNECGATATMNVIALPECSQPYDAVLLSPWGRGIGPAPRFVGARVLVVSELRTYGVSAIDSVPNNGLAYCTGKAVGSWSIGYSAGSGNVFAECVHADGNINSQSGNYWHLANGTMRYC